jgi:hypothetical protein
MDHKRSTPYSVSDRTFDGAASMWLRKSQDEAPEVANYNYDDVAVQGYEGSVTELADFNAQWSTSLFGETITSKGAKSEAATLDADTLMNDAWFCILVGDVGKLGGLLERARIAGLEFPADYPMKNMFGVSSLWSRVQDSDFKIPPGSRDEAVRVLVHYHRRDL